MSVSDAAAPVLSSITISLCKTDVKIYQSIFARLQCKHNHSSSSEREWGGGASRVDGQLGLRWSSDNTSGSSSGGSCCFVDDMCSLWFGAGRSFFRGGCWCRCFAGRLDCYGFVRSNGR